MLNRLPIGVSDFAKIATEDYVFADKTLFIKEVIEEGSEVMLITRPRRFGKTLNLSMLNYFLNVNTDSQIFNGLKVKKDKRFCKEHQNKYPVIFISFKDIKFSNFLDAYNQIQSLYSNLYSEHIHLLEGDALTQGEKSTFQRFLESDSTKSDIILAMQLLSKYLFRKYNQKPIILIDEYDTPIQAGYLNGYYPEIVELMRGIFGTALKDNSYLHKAIITGITRVSQESLFSGVNNLEVYSILREKYGQYFGFVEEELQYLLSKVTHSDNSLSAIKEWYNGYTVGKYTVCNPWSIINCLKNNGELKPYWVNTASNELIDRLLAKSNLDVKTSLEMLLQNKPIAVPLSEHLVFPDIEEDEDALWSLLLYAGYLKVLFSEVHGLKLKALVLSPNKEILFVYQHIIERWFGRVIGNKAYESFMNSLILGNMEQFELILSSYILESSSYFDFNRHAQEQIFHVFILGLIVGLKERYMIHSNKESGYGRYDVMLMPLSDYADKFDGIIMEFKVAKSSKESVMIERAKAAIEQIKAKKYMDQFKANNTKRVLAIGISFCGKNVKVCHEYHKV